MRVQWACGRLLAAAVAVGWLAAAPQAPPAANAAEAVLKAEMPSPDVRNFLDLLAKPDVQKWLTEQGAAANVSTVTDAQAPAGATQPGMFTEQLNRIRQHIEAIIAALPLLPGDLEQAADKLRAEVSGHGILKAIMLIVVFAALGLGLRWIYLTSTTGFRRRINGIPTETPRERVMAIGVLLAWELAAVAAFAIGSIGAFLAVAWPPLLKETVAGYLFAAVIVWATVVIVRSLLSPPDVREDDAAERYRVVPVPDSSAAFWSRKLALLIGWFTFGWVTVALLEVLGVPMISRDIIAYLFGIVLLAILMDMVWRSPPSHISSFARIVVTPRAQKVLASVLLALLWLSWVAGAMHIFWLIAVIVAIPAGSRLAQRSVNHVLRTPGLATTGDEPPSVAAAVIGRGVRAALLIGGILMVARAWNLDLRQLTAAENVETRLLRGLFSAAVIVLVADFLWHLLKTVIDLKIAQAQGAPEGTPEEMRRRARIQTLLPITRNILMAVVGIVAVLMALASLGVEIGPLIAGAGVLGVAIGFGAQTIVKDVISGMFYLLDDAFRVGEYIQSGSHAGTVESFSIRSIKLRGARGSLFTVPFGELGSVENQSRDWAIDKITIGITYDSDIVKAKKLIRQVGQQLAADPELGPDIMEPLKMQGVDAFSDNAVKIKLKIMTKPGKQTTIRRAAYFLIKKAFDENGIKFAFPQVRVAGQEGVQAAAVTQAVASQ
jgi:small-conductance mechanosensitive channel